MWGALPEKERAVQKYSECIRWRKYLSRAVILKILLFYRHVSAYCLPNATSRFFQCGLRTSKMCRYPPRLPQPRGKHRKMASILIVDDQSYVRELLSEELAHEGYRVASVGDTESIWRYLRDSPPDVVLLDLYLNGFEGWEVLNGIKRKDPNLPVLIVTAYDSFADDPRLSQAAGYVVKSFASFAELKEKIAGILGWEKVPQPDNKGYSANAGM